MPVGGAARSSTQSVFEDTRGLPSLSFEMDKLPFFGGLAINPGKPRDPKLSDDCQLYAPFGVRLIEIALASIPTPVSVRPHSIAESLPITFRLRNPWKETAVSVPSSRWPTIK